MGDFTHKELDELKACSLLHELPDNVFHQFLALASRINFAEHDILLKEGEHSDQFFIILSGAVGLYKQNTKGKAPELILTLSPGQTLGEMRVIQNRTISLTAKALEPTVVLAFSISTLRSPENQSIYDAILGSIITILNDRLANSNDSVLDNINEKKRKTKQLIFTVLISIVFTILLVEVALALYYAMNSEDFCSRFTYHSAQMLNINSLKA